MLASDLAIAGGGTTLYELAATGTPTFAFCLADNQGRNIKGMSGTGTLINMGWGNKFDKEAFRKEVSKLADRQILRKRMSRKGQELVDGKGNLRVSKVIMGSFLERQPEFIRKRKQRSN